MKCPHCNKRDNNEHIQRASRNAETYGENFFIFKCTVCGKKYGAYFEVKVVINAPHIVGPAKELSFG